ncbi:MAG: DUF835 domain-containing protein [Methanobacteriota archaeon]|nr:MAG: DUF835 domain-containing protein [Euryarchaeota archaeon]
MMIGIILPIVVVLLAIMILLWLKRRKKEEEPSDEVSEPFEFEPQEGMGYIFVNNGRDRSYETLISEIEKGSSGLCFTRTFPPMLKKQYQLKDTKILWLSRDEEKGGFIPTNLGAISNVVEKFLKENKENRTVVVIDGLEYLMAQNGFSKVLKLVHNLKDMVGVSSGSLFIPFNLKSVEERQAALLSGDLEVIE